jgi:hypothetical protein
VGRGIVHSKGNEGDVKEERKHPKRKKGPKGGALEEKRYYIVSLQGPQLFLSVLFTSQLPGFLKNVPPKKGTKNCMSK